MIEHKTVQGRNVLKKSYISPDFQSAVSLHCGMNWKLILKYQIRYNK